MRGIITDMDIVTVALIIAVLVLVYLLLRERETPAEEGNGMVLLQQQLQNSPEKIVLT